MLSRYLLAASLALAGAAHAQTWPTKPVKVLVPFAAGGGVDIVARFVATRLGAQLGQQFLIENRGGAGGTIATGMVAKAPADGYTLLVAHQGLAFNATLYANPGFDTQRDLVPIAMIGATPNVIVMNPVTPIRNVGELIAYAKANPGALAYGTGGVGSAGHLATEYLQSLAGVKMTHVPYKGSGPALTDLMAGQIQLMFLVLPPAVSHVKSGKLRAIATSGAKRTPVLPNTPTVAESGVPAYEYTPWFGWFGPSGLPQPVIDRLNQSVNAVLAEPATREQLAAQGLEIDTGTPERFSKIVRDDIARWGKIIRDAGIKVE